MSEWIDLSNAWLSTRRETLAVLEEVAETKLSRTVTERPGWTLRHSVTFLAALDAEVLQLAAGEELSAWDLRRLRGEAMFAAQYLRMRDLLPHLADTAQRVEDFMADNEPDDIGLIVVAIAGKLAEAKTILGIIKEANQ
ncbi:MAG: hypothetical protein P8J64_02585 [Dehalococcoidia bacterium]|nr:hypothetical protein [Dehalococcoidia bacterium]